MYLFVEKMSRKWSYPLNCPPCCRCSLPPCSRGAAVRFTSWRSDRTRSSAGNIWSADSGMDCFGLSFFYLAWTRLTLPSWTLADLPKRWTSLKDQTVHFLSGFHVVHESVIPPSLIITPFSSFFYVWSVFRRWNHQFYAPSRRFKVQEVMWVNRKSVEVCCCHGGFRRKVC